jgi:hypothetical protein
MKTLTITCSDAQAEHLKAYVQILNNNRSSIRGGRILVRERTADDFLDELYELIGEGRADSRMVSAA